MANASSHVLKRLGKAATSFGTYFKDSQEAAVAANAASTGDRYSLPREPVEIWLAVVGLGCQPFAHAAA